MKASRHPEQTERLKALYHYDILDTPRETDFDDIAKLASDICDTPIAIVTFIEDDRQWFKAEVGTGGMTGTTFEQAICSHAILQEDLLVIPDAQEDARTACNPLVTGAHQIRFYAGAVLKSKTGYPLGTLCVLDQKPRELSASQKFALQVLANQVMAQLELRLALRNENKARLLAEKKVEEQIILVAEVDHRVKNSLAMVSGLLRIQASRAKNDETKLALKAAENRVHAISLLHSELHSVSTYDEVRVDQFITRLAANLQDSTPSHISLSVDLPELTLNSSKAGAIGIIFNEFVANSVKHAFPEDRDGKIIIEGRFVDGGFNLKLCDNGIGYADAPIALQPKGLGMKIIEASVSQLGGQMTLNKKGAGAHVEIFIPFEAARGMAAA